MKKILIIEDDEDLSGVLAVGLGVRNFAVKSVFDGKDAMNEIRTYRPDLILLDIMLPHIDGWEICRQVKAAPDLKKIHVVMMTGKTGAQFKEKGKQLGSDEFFNKPFDMICLIQYIEDMLSKDPARGETK